MEVRDVRRMAVTVLLAAALLVGWLVALHAQQAGWTSWALAQAGLEALRMRTWLWLGIVTMGVLVLVGAMLVFGVGVLPPGWAKGAIRQVQCDHCKAVFFVNDTGHRPLTHQCPNCRYLGIYDGTDEPKGDAHRTVGKRDVVQLALRCRSCSHRFEVTDTGMRPLRVECPECQEIGRLR